MPIAIVTGASGGIGTATCIELAKNGYDVVIQYAHNKKSADELARRIETLGVKSLVAKVDFSNPHQAEKDIEKMVNKTIEKFERIDALANLAGYPIKELETWQKQGKNHSIDDLQKILNVDTFGTFLCIKKVAPIMTKQEKGSIINISSTPALSGYAFGFGFHVAKSANLALTKSFALELSPYVRVNTIALGSIETIWTKSLTKEEYRQLVNEIPLKRLGKPEEVAKVIVFLASDDSSFINGQTIVVDGGVVMH